MNRSLSVLLLLIPMGSVFSQQSSPPFRDKVLPALFNGTVQNELDLADDQKSKLRRMLDGLMEKRRKIQVKLRELSRSGVSREAIKVQQTTFVQELEEEKKTIEDEALDVLLPHQVKRLQQVTVQMMLKQNAEKTALLSREIVDYLNIDPEQQKEIRAKAAKLKQELEEKIRRLTREANDELLSTLNSGQRKKYQELIGKPLRGPMP